MHKNMQGGNIHSNLFCTALIEENLEDMFFVLLISKGGDGKDDLIMQFNRGS